MEATTVIFIYNLLKKNHISLVVDGGWGIDALIGKQTRKHNDLDIAVDYKDVDSLCSLLKEQGYNKSHALTNKEYNFILEDLQGNKIDVHVYKFDNQGNNIYGIAYPFDSLKGEGTIYGTKVRCIALEYVLQFHENYDPDPEDIEDIKQLVKNFSVKPPMKYINKL